MMINTNTPAIIETYDKSGQAVHPSVLYFANKFNGYRYWMAYTPYTDTNERVENPSIAVSNDGLKFHTPKGLTNPLDYPEAGVINATGHFSDTDMIVVNGRLEVFYRYRLRGWGERIFRKTSTDGINWSPREIVWQDTADTSGAAILSPALIYEDNLYKMWYVGNNGVISYTTSATGKRDTWSEPEIVSVSYKDTTLKTWHISIYKEGNKYYLLSNAIKGGSSINRVLTLGSSVSPTTFSQLETVLVSNKNGSNFDNEYIYRSCMIKEEDGYFRLFYSATSQDRKWGIGILGGMDIFSLSKARAKIDTPQPPPEPPIIPPVDPTPQPPIIPDPTPPGEPVKPEELLPEPRPEPPSILVSSNVSTVELYKNGDEDFQTNGIMLNDAIACTIEEELNGKYLLELTYPIDEGGKFNYLQEENIIKADGQLFRIYSTDSNLGYINVKARHIFYDLLHNFLEDVRPTQLNGNNALNWILGSTQYPHKFRGVGDVSTITTQYFIRKNPVEAILGVDSLTTRWGGELVRDNFTIRLLRTRGANKGAKIAYGKNLLGLEVERNMDNVVTRIMPIGKEELKLPEKYIDSPLINNYAYPYIKVVEFDDGAVEGKEGKDGEVEIEAITEAQALASMRQKVTDMYEFGKVDIPYININANLVLLENTEEYKDLKHLVKVDLGDTVSCTDNPLNIEFEAKVIRVKKDVLSNKNVEVELGRFRKGIGDTIQNVLEEIKEEIEINKSDLEKAIGNATDLITNNLGGYVVKRPGEILIMDEEDPLVATKVWRWNING